MSARKPGLGRSFSSLIPTELLDESFDPTAAQDEKVSELRQIKIAEIAPDPDQPRKYFDETSLTDMALSIKTHGVLQPIVVTPSHGKYLIVAGERRFRASQLAGLDKVPALVRTLNNQHKLELSLIENLHRRDLNVLETATAYLKLRDQFNLSLDEISKRVGGKSISAISNTIRLLRLPKAVHQAIAEGIMSEGQARPLVGVDEEVIEQVLPKILAEEWSVRKVEQFVVQLKKSQEKLVVEKTKKQLVEPIAHQAATKRMAKHLAAEVKVRTNAHGAGKIEIRFKDEQEFERIQKLLA